MPRLVHAYLDEQRAVEWLLVCDDMDDVVRGFAEDISFIKSILQTERTFIIFNTIDKGVTKTVALQHNIKIQEVSSDSDQEMMESYLDNPISPQDQEQAELLLNELSFLPLAIVHAAAFLNTKKVTM